MFASQSETEKTLIIWWRCFWTDSPTFLHPCI